MSKNLSKKRIIQEKYANEAKSTETNLTKEIQEIQDNRFSVLDIDIQPLLAAHSTRINKIYVCKICEKACNLRSYSFLEHLYSSHGIGHPRFLCKLCGYRTYMKFQMQTHLFHSHEPKTKEFICKVCGKSYGTKLTLLRHEKLHSSTPTFKCKDCDASFLTLNQLYYHKQSHNTNLSIPCDHPGCEKEFPNDFRLRIHKRQVHTNSLHFCSICGTSFKTNFNLKRHQEVVHKFYQLQSENDVTSKSEENLEKESNQEKTTQTFHRKRKKEYIEQFMKEIKELENQINNQQHDSISVLESGKVRISLPPKKSKSRTFVPLLSAEQTDVKVTMCDSNAESEPSNVWLLIPVSSQPESHLPEIRPRESGLEQRESILPMESQDAIEVSPLEEDPPQNICEVAALDEATHSFFIENEHEMLATYDTNIFQDIDMSHEFIH